MSLRAGRQGLIPSDYEQLDQSVNRKEVIRLADVQDKIERVAFDVVRFRDSEGLDKLWVVEDQDGEQVLVATYEDDSETHKEATASVNSWSALSDNVGNVSVYYKGEPITRLAVSQLGLPESEAHTVCRYLPNKLASDNSWKTALLSELPPSDREVILNKYPELKG